MSAYAELVTATNFSFLRGASHPDEMVRTAAELGCSAIGVADRNSLAGVVRAHAAAKEAGLKLLVGARLVSEEGLEAVCYPADRAAYGRLTRMLTLGKRRAEKGECRLTLPDIAAFAQGQLFILMPPAKASPDWERLALRLLEAAPDSTYLALTRRFDGADGARLHCLSLLASRLGAPTIATADALMHTPDRRQLADVLTCIREGVSIDTAGLRLARNVEAHLKPPAEQARLFAGYEDAVARTIEVANRIIFSLDEISYQYPDEVIAPGETAMQTLRRLTWEGAGERYPHGLSDKVRATLEHELELVEQLDYAPYFLTVHDLVRFARSKGILCQGRGSAANSSVCYCLGVTAVDPSQVDLLFERFISAERGEPPDIDIDFEHERREEVIQYVYDKYGRERAGLAATVITYRTRSAVREVGKALGVSADMLDALAGTVWGWSERGVQDAHVRDELGLDPHEPRLSATLELARELVGFPRHLSQHVGGFVITRDRLDEIAPIENARMDDRTVVEWDKDDLETLGILKVDVLALGMLTLLARSFDFLNEHYGVTHQTPPRAWWLDGMDERTPAPAELPDHSQERLDLADIPRGDPSVYDMICKADTIGVFQIESRAQMSMLPRLKPRTFYDLVIEVAIVRPGPIQGDMVHPYLRRREGLEEVTFPSQELRQVLGKTLGVPLFQEQAMKIAIVAAGFTPGEADQLRRAMATFKRSGLIHRFGERLVEGMVANGYDADFAERCFKQIEGFGEYGFPESHAASFALLVYVSAWMKHHYPDVFLASVLNAQPMGFYGAAQLVRDARAHGVEVRPPDINASDWDATLESRAEPPSGSFGNAYAVRLGLRQIKGLNEAEAAKITAARDDGGPFMDVEDVQRRACVRRATLERIAEADACRSLGRDRRHALWEAKALAGPPLPLFAASGEGGHEEGAALPDMPLSEHVVHDYAHLKLSLKAHPIAFLRGLFDATGVRTAQAANAARDGSRVSIVGLVLVRQRPGSASGVIFMTLEDETGVVNAIVWPKVFARFRRIVMGARMVRVTGRLQREGLVVHLVVETLADVSHRLVSLSDGLTEIGDVAARADETTRNVEDRRVRSLMNPASVDSNKTRARNILPRSRDFH